MTWKPDYATVAEVKAVVGIPTADTGDDALLAAMITAASRAIDAAANRQFGLLAAPAAWTYTAEWRSDLGGYVVPIDDLQTITGLAVEFDGSALATYRLWPAQAPDKGEAWTALVIDRDDAGALDETAHGVTVTARFGWTAVPTIVNAATRLQASRFFARRESPHGVSGSPELGSETRLLARVDPDVSVMVRAVHRPEALL